MEESELNDLVESVKFQKMGRKTTICLATLKTGFEIIGTSACVNAEDYVKELGETYAYQDVLRKLEELEGYARHTPSWTKA